MKVTVAICTRNRRAYLEKAVESVLPQIGEDCELLIVDNRSTDGTLAAVVAMAKRDGRIRYEREERPGISFARNAALRSARGEWVLFFDDDEIAPDGWLDAYLHFFVAHGGTRVGAVGGGCEPEFETPPPGWFYMKWARYDMGAEELRLVDHRTPGAGNCAIHRAAALELGGFSEKLARAEDTDLIYRLQLAGYEVWWLPNAAILHIISGERLTIAALARMAFAEGESVARLRLLHRGSALSRETYRFGRLLISPFYSLALFAASIVTIPVRRGQVAARNLQRAVRALGIASQLIADLRSKKGAS
jgi:glycosyltransferase involved in cell wall biosynthesis